MTAWVRPRLRYSTIRTPDMDDTEELDLLGLLELLEKDETS